jgi:Lar family restriction alleviation protein
MADPNDDPRSCPFCGYERPEVLTSLCGAAAIRCSECGAQGPRQGTQAEAWLAWNRRVGSAVDGARESLAIAAKVRAEERERVAAAFEARANTLEARAGERFTVPEAGEMRTLAAWVRGGCKE